MEYDLHLEPVVVESDSDMLLQVWTNVIDNAIKYSKEHSVIRIQICNEEAFVRVEIKDAGEGIPCQSIVRSGTLMIVRIPYEV